MYRDKSRDKYSDWKQKDDHKDENSLYVLPGNRHDETGNSSMKALLMKLFKGSESQESCRKKIKVDILELSQKVESYTTAIKQLEQHFNKMSTIIHQHQPGTLLSITLKNPMNDSHYLAIMTQSGNVLLIHTCQWFILR